LRSDERSYRGREKKSQEGKKSVLSYRGLDLRIGAGEIKWE
jgi:hypothetical protein